MLSSPAALRLVELSDDHPGFSDPVYRRRRDEIAALAIAHRGGGPAPSVEYTVEEREVWALVHDQLVGLHRLHACREHLAAWPRIGFTSTRVPQLAEVSAVLATASGFSLQPVPGLVTPRAFMEALGDGTFLATQYMRHHSRPLYTPEPDLIHELCGHAPLLSDPRYAELNRLFGEATRRADDARVEALIRVYWFGLEFGLVREDGVPKAFGAGLLSSIGEIGRVAHEAELRRFSIAEIARTPFDTMRYQDVLFVADDVDALYAELRAFLAD